MWAKTKKILALIDTRNLPFQEKNLIIRIGDIMKISTKMLDIGELKFPRYQENEKVCLYTYEGMLKNN